MLVLPVQGSVFALSNWGAN